MIYQDIYIRFLAKVWMNQLTTIDLWISYFAECKHSIVRVNSDRPYTQLLRIILARVTKATPDGGYLSHSVLLKKDFVFQKKMFLESFRLLYENLYVDTNACPFIRNIIIAES